MNAELTRLWCKRCGASAAVRPRSALPYGWRAVKWPEIDNGEFPWVDHLCAVCTDSFYEWLRSYRDDLTGGSA